MSDTRGGRGGRGGRGSHTPFRGGRNGNSIRFPNPNQDKMEECDQHIRPANVHEGPRRLGESVDTEHKYRRVLKKGEKRGDCLCDYHDFATLLEERQSLDDEFKHYPNDKVFRFMDMPLELRIRVNEVALVSPEPVEFCPEPFYFDGTCTSKWQDWLEPFRASSKKNEEIMEEFVYPFSRLMRVSKTIHEEASKVFYGQNEFRFSNVSGWVGLDLFLYQIDLVKCSLLRNVTVCHPALSVRPTTLGTAPHFLRGMNELNPRLPRDAPSLYHYERWFDKTNGEDATRVLEKAGKLQYLQYVLPAGRRELVPELTDMCVDAARFEGLRISVLSLENEHTDEQTELAQLDDVVVSVMEKSAVQSAQVIRIDELGGYPKIIKGVCQGDVEDDDGGEEKTIGGEEADQEEAEEGAEEA